MTMVMEGCPIAAASSSVSLFLFFVCLCFRSPELLPPLFLCLFALFSSLCFFRSLPFVAFSSSSFFLCSALPFMEPESLPKPVPVTVLHLKDC